MHRDWECLKNPPHYYCYHCILCVGRAVVVVIVTVTVTVTAVHMLCTVCVCVCLLLLFRSVSRSDDSCYVTYVSLKRRSNSINTYNRLHNLQSDSDLKI